MKKKLSFIVSLCIAGVVGYFLAGFLEPPAAAGMSRIEKLLLLLSVPVAGLLAILVHELGHVAVGRMQDFDFYGLTVGPFLWQPDERGRIRLRRNRNLNVAGGVALMMPNGEHNLRNRFRWYALGGPLFSLLLAALCVGGSFLLIEYPLVSSVLYLTGAVSGAIGLVTLIPSQAGGMMSDGKRFLTLSRDSDRAAASVASLQGLAVLRAGRPYADLPVATIERSLASDEDIHASERAALLYYRFLYQLGQDNPEAAGDSLDQIIALKDELPPAAGHAYHLTRALYHARYRRDLPAARADFAEFRDNPFTQPAEVALVRAAIADLEDDRATLAAELPLIEAGLPRMIDRTAVPTYEAWLTEWRGKLSEPT